MKLQIRHATVQYAADIILPDVNFDIHDKEKIAIVGRNGCGKTTLLKLISGEITMSNPDSDEECCFNLAGGTNIGFLKQINFQDKDILVENEIKKVFSAIYECQERMRSVEKQLSERPDDEMLLKQYSTLQARWEALNGDSAEREMYIMFQQFGFSLDDLKRPIGSFSGGQQTKIAFIKLLLSHPDILLLDEPTNHLDLPAIEWLEGYLRNYPSAVVIVSHDRAFLDRIVTVTYEIEYGIIKR